MAHIFLARLRRSRDWEEKKKPEGKKNPQEQTSFRFLSIFEPMKLEPFLSSNPDLQYWRRTRRAQMSVGGGRATDVDGKLDAGFRVALGVHLRLGVTECATSPRAK